MNSTQAPQARPAFWKNPFLIAFALGVVFLTALPFLQRGFLKAPPPILRLGSWTLNAANGDGVSSARLEGRVWLATFLPPDCPQPCRERQEAFGAMLDHVADLDGGVALVTFAPVSVDVSQWAKRAPGRWYVVQSSPDTLEAALAPFRTGFSVFSGRDGGLGSQQLSELGAVALVDQAGFLRGFWKEDVAGRGNAINAARLLARYGPAP